MAFSEGSRMDNDRGNLMASNLKNSHSDAFKDSEKNAERHRPFFQYNYKDIMPSHLQAPILEIGSGLGEFLMYCKSTGYQDILGLDLSDENISHCESKGLTVQHADAIEFLLNTQKTYDAIVMNDVIEHLNKAEVWKILGLIKSRLSPNGCVIIKTFNMANPFLGGHCRYLDFTHETGWSQESMAQVLNGVGYSRVIVKPSKLFVYYKNPLNYIAITIEWFVSKLLRLYFLMNGRKRATIFTKNIIGIGYK